MAQDLALQVAKWASSVPNCLLILYPPHQVALNLAHSDTIWAPNVPDSYGDILSHPQSGTPPNDRPAIFIRTCEKAWMRESQGWELITLHAEVPVQCFLNMIRGRGSKVEVKVEVKVEDRRSRSNSGRDRSQVEVKVEVENQNQRRSAKK